MLVFQSPPRFLGRRVEMTESWLRNKNSLLPRRCFLLEIVPVLATQMVRGTIEKGTSHTIFSLRLRMVNRGLQSLCL